MTIVTERAPISVTNVPQQKLLLSLHEVADLFGVSLRRAQELRAAGHIGDPIMLGPRQLRWPRVEIEEAIAKMPRQRAAGEPAELLRSRIERMKRTGEPA